MIDVADPFILRIRDAVGITNKIVRSNKEAHKMLGELTERACHTYRKMLNCEMEGLDGAMTETDAAIDRLEVAAMQVLEAQSVQDVMDS